ncbi:uncharacterized protein AMSG_02540 [Thecamonas trahens ATCC 50062]|uniref:Uncharacterized protein n=1 Tax=Thecamonas trahens ATCC 50062 TaxID=461836 RepID=A0A0L0D617_THETB|nr:hypothetical protein AMSG_02540 [Thecamonas trahens ATCC 50062]KNC47521.1 hypothetical protein AMSG_02540 [Thecamonas trahens ATCC 50062]|eukprot:XP_013759454.1 hypothetical protein AMSG_02540 [Thecamonas trahens ATCC 50062]
MGEFEAESKKPDGSILVKKSLALRSDHRRTRRRNMVQAGAVHALVHEHALAGVFGGARAARRGEFTAARLFGEPCSLMFDAESSLTFLDYASAVELADLQAALADAPSSCSL